MKTREELLKELDESETIASKSSFLDDWNTQRKIGIDGVKDILQAPTQEQQSCEMCHATLSGCAYTIADYQHQIKSFVSGLNPDAIKNIKYCQWCGRELGDD